MLRGYPISIEPPIRHECAPVSRLDSIGVSFVGVITSRPGPEANVDFTYLEELDVFESHGCWVRTLGTDLPLLVST